MPTFSQKIFLGLLGLVAVATSDVQAQSKAASQLFHQKRELSRGSEALRGTNATVVKPGQSMNYSWNTTSNRWEVYSKQENTYDASARVTQELYRDSATNVANNRYQYQYDAQGNQTSYLSQVFQNGAWVNSSRSLVTFDSHGNETQYLSQSWDGSSWITTNGSQYANAYDAAGILVERIYKDLVNGTFVNDERNVYTVANGRWTGITTQSWENGAWVDNERVTDIVWYDWAAMKPTSYREQEFNGTAFVDTDRYTITYTNDGGAVELRQRYTNGTWNNYRRYTSTYDSRGNETSDITEQWTNNAWVLRFGTRITNVYNSSNVLLRRAYQEFDETTARYVNHDRYNYSNFQTIILANHNVTLEAQASLYPNPASGIVTLEVGGLSKAERATGEVRNALGQLVQNFTVQPQGGKLSTQLDVSRLQSGVYTVRLQTSEGTIVKRVVRN